MSDNCCQNEIILLEESLENVKCEATKLKQQYYELLIENLQKDVIIKNLKRKIEQHKYGSFRHILSEKCLDELKSIGNSSKEDSAFISCALKDLYREKMDSLKHKTLSGRVTKNVTSQISPQKMSTLKRLFDERLSHVSQTDVNDTRRKNMNKQIRNIIDSLKTKSV